MITKVVRGCEKEVVKKREDRIQEALSIKFLNPNEPIKFVVDNIQNGIEVYFLKPGKEYFRPKKKRLNDMSPNVGELFTNFSFADIWQLLCKLRNTISLDNYKKLSAILYRVAYLIDFTNNNGKVRFSPSTELLNEIQEIQTEVDDKNLEVNILAFIHFLDVLGWNEDVKYHTEEYAGEIKSYNFGRGRINTILSCISIPLILQKFVEEVLKGKKNTANIDFSIVIDTMQEFSRTRGVLPISNTKLIEFLSPYLEN